MKLYNTLKREVEELKPLNPPTATIYTCGPTVYDYPHVGNWFTFIRYDLLVRALKASGLQPKWVMNITDVGHLTSDADEGEDKLEKGARREGKTAQEIADFYTSYFIKGLERLNITRPAELPRATEHIPEQIELIQKLEEKGFTYQTSDGVYYDTSRFPRYADFARLDLDEQQAGARVERNPEKRNQTDFALWKFSPAGVKRDMEWDSPWGKGFPGWHVECSAMSMKYLGETMDIHAGGIDHIAVHHTNEIAQTEAITDKPTAQIWMHSNHITINGEKVSKSLGNGITLEDIEARGISLEAFRLHVMESHYRSQSKFSWDSLQAAQNRLTSYERMADLQFQAVNHDDNWLSDLGNMDTINSAIQDDLNTPLALATISCIATLAEGRLVSTSQANMFHEVLIHLDQLLGLRLSERKDIQNDQKELITQREDARKNKDWAKSDELRDQLKEQGIGVRDTEYGPIWYRI